MEMMEGYKQTELGVIPEDWEVSSFCDLGDTLIGLTYSPANVRDSGTLVLRSSNIQNGRLTFKDNVFVDMEVPARATTREGDLLICVRNGSRALIGKSVLIDKSTAGAAFGAFMSVFRSERNPYLAFVFDSEFIKRQVSEILGATINQITSRDLNGFLAPLPPTEAEQEAIAEALNDADALIESLEQLIAKKRQIKQGAMQELLTGKKRLPSFSGEWEETTIGGLASLWKGGSNPGLHPERIFTHYSLPAFDNGRAPVTEPGRLIGSNKFTVPPSSVLLSKLNPRIPRIWAPDEIPENAICSTEFLVLLPNEGTNREFLAILCSSNVVSDQMKLHATGTTGSHQRIHPPQAMALELFIPSDPDEQTAIATILSDMDAAIAALETKLAKARQVKQGMMQELLTGSIRLFLPERSHV